MTALDYYSSYIVYPLLKLQYSLISPVKSYFQKRQTVTELHEQIATLQQERDHLLSHNIELNSLIGFAQDTQEVIEFKSRYDFSQAILAQILVKNFSEQSHFFLIDRGLTSHIQKDMVVVYKDCIIGKVAEVYPYYSKVVLVSDKSCKIAAYCSQSKATGIYQGTNEGWHARLDHVSHLAAPEVGELVLSSGDGLIFPRGFGLGKIKQFCTNGLFHEISI